MIIPSIVRQPWRRYSDRTECSLPGILPVPCRFPHASKSWQLQTVSTTFCQFPNGLLISWHWYCLSFYKRRKKPSGECLVFCSCKTPWHLWEWWPLLILLLKVEIIRRWNTSGLYGLVNRQIISHYLRSTLWCFSESWLESLRNLSTFGQIHQHGLSPWLPNQNNWHFSQIIHCRWIARINLTKSHNWTAL